jgi:hypothetical protein
MDINLLFSAGLRKCGRVLNILPTSEIGSPKQYMMKVLTEETIPALNIVFPRLFKTTFPASALIPLNSNGADIDRPGIDSRYCAYRIPTTLTEGLDIMSIKSCVPGAPSGPTNGNGMFNGLGTSGRFGRYSSADMYEAVSRSQLQYADALMMGPFTEAFRYYFYSPNIFYMNRDASERGLMLTATFCLKNDPNLISIEETAYEGVKELFILDLKSSIYEQYAMHTEVDTPIGTLSLKIDDWASATSDRKELYDLYRSTSHLRTASMRTG